MESNSVDTIITDPPAGISFMGKEWDKDRGGRDNWIEWLGEVMAECFRVAKPGATALVWAIPRTSHWTALGIESGGWVIKDCIYHIFGSGFPKSTDISKQLDKGHERRVVGINKVGSKERKGFKGDMAIMPHKSKTIDLDITEPATPEAKLWNGWGTALKPAVECWWVAVKPNEGTYAGNALKHGVAGLNIDGGRVGFQNKEDEEESKGKNQHSKYPKSVVRNAAKNGIYHQDLRPPEDYTAQGRFPANILLSCSCDPPDRLPKEVAEEVYKFEKEHPEMDTGWFGDVIRKVYLSHREHFIDCPVRMLDEQSGDIKAGYRKNPSTKKTPYTYQDKEYNVEGFIKKCKPQAPSNYADGSNPSRFFYCAKASKAERNMGCEGLENKKFVAGNYSQSPVCKDCKLTLNGTNDHSKCSGEVEYRKMKSEITSNNHPTVKPLKLLEYLCTLTKTPTGGIVLDPFMGSGTTCMAAKKTGRNYIGIEKESEYVEIAKKRIASVVYQPELFLEETK